jgi:alkylation response protein AidB-like acyl-CoA dehydrogenase
MMRFREAGKVQHFGPQPTALATYRENVREIVKAMDLPVIPHDPEEAFAVRRAWQALLVSRGLLGVNWPREYGGQGLTPAYQTVAMEEVVRIGAPTPASVVNLYVVGPTLLAWGTPEQKARFVPRLLTGEEIWCQGFSEPNAGSDLASLQTRAIEDGDDYIVNGQKIWTSQAQYADFCALLVRTDPSAAKHKGLSYLIMDMRLPGIEVRPIRQISGGTGFNEVFLTDVRIPRSSMIGPPNEGWKVIVRSLSSERSTIIAQRAAEARRAFDVTTAALRRHLRATGQNLPPELAGRIGHAAMQLAVLQAQQAALSSRLERDQATGGVESIDKLVLTEAEQEVFSLALDMLGPARQLAGHELYGFDADLCIHDYFYSRSRSISAGTTQIQRNIVAERVLGLPRS